MKRFILSIPNHSQWASQLLSITQFCFESASPSLDHGFVVWNALLSGSSMVHQMTRLPGAVQTASCIMTRGAWATDHHKSDLLFNCSSTTLWRNAYHLWATLCFAMFSLITVWWDRRSVHTKGRHSTTKLSRPKSTALLLPAGLLLMQVKAGGPHRHQAPLVVVTDVYK